ncbi:MAG TPA: class I SAM-dependent methyltransferase [Pyrinomonadaceae bacterium]
MAVSFRDPDGRVMTFDDRVIRVVRESAEAELESFLSSHTAQKFVGAGRLVRTTRLGARRSCAAFGSRRETESAADTDVFYEHERVSFPSFPYEWPPQMLYEAGVLTLDLAESALEDGYELKDASAYNVLFRGTHPVFVDLLSFKRRGAGGATWLAEAQFSRNFLLPLLANKYFKLSLQQLFLARRDGVEPEEAYRWSGRAQKFREPFLTLASIPTWLARGADDKTIYDRPRLSSDERARFILRRLYKRLRRKLETVRPASAQSSSWSDYESSCRDTAEEYLGAKLRFVAGVCDEFRPRAALDVGCNKGFFTRAAAERGASVVAIDRDPAVVGHVCLSAAARKLNILPLVIDLTRPSSGTGWRNEENSSFLGRARGRFDALFMLAVVHHMLVGERIPPREILALAAELTTDLLVVEFVAPDDPMFQRLARGREHLYQGLTNEVFRSMCLERFVIVRCERLAGASRWLYLLRKK